MAEAPFVFVFVFVFGIIANVTEILEGAERSKPALNRPIQLAICSLRLEPT